MERDLGTSRRQSSANPLQEPDPAGAGPTGGTTFTVYFPTDDGYRGADLAHPAPLPMVGDQVEYLDEEGSPHRYRVVRVVHTLQAAPAYRPRGRDRAGEAGAGEVGAGETAAGERGADQSAVRNRSIPEGSELRAGLPEVFLEALQEEGAPGAT